MVKKTKGKHRLDKFYHLAKEQGYRSRAAFKLIQLNRKYNFLANARALLDLCAAPGGWLQVATQNMPVSSLIIGVDLVPIKPVRGARVFVSDITSAQCRQLIKREAAGSMFDVVVHDGAPNVGGAWASEAYTQSALVVDALKLATEFLAPNGTFVTKVFRSKDYNALLYGLGQLFNKVEATKPQASRNASAEIFVVCLGYKAPAKIDPRLLDPKHLFQEVAEAPKVMGPDALLKMKMKQKRHREGYEDGLSTSHKPLSAVQFLLSDAPVELLGRATKFELEGSGSQVVDAADSAAQGLDIPALAAAVREAAQKDPEVRALCGDLQVLGRSEFKHLLKWRLQLRKDLKHLLEPGEAESSDAESGGGSSDEELDPEEKLLQEMQEVKEGMEKRKKKEKKKRREQKQKARVRSAQMAQGEGLGEEGGAVGADGESLFSLSALPALVGEDAAAAAGSKKKGKKQAAGDVLSKLADTRALGELEMEELDAPSSDEEPEGSGEELSADEAALEYEAQMEEALEDAYQQYLTRQGVRDAAAKEKRLRLGKGGELDAEAGSDEDDQTAAGGSSSDEEDGEEYVRHMEQQVAAKAAAKKGAGLLVELDDSCAGVAKGGAAAAAQWFGQREFGDMLESSDDEEQQAAPAGRGKRQQQQQQAVAASQGDSEEEEDEDAAAPAAKRQRQQNGTARPSTAAAAAGDGGTFEVVPQEAADGSSSDSEGRSSGSDSDEDEFDQLDNQGKAEVLALARKMIRRKGRESIMDAAYNRYAFHDTFLPRWFEDDERRHMRPVPQTTKAEVDAEKARLAAIDARPIKKVLEAKARKRKRAQARMEAARAKATSVAAQEDLPMGSKLREIEKLYAKARASNGPGKKGKKGGKGDRGKKGPPLDKRMLKDKRGLQRAAKRQKGGGRKGGKAGGRGRR